MCILLNSPGSGSVMVVVSTVKRSAGEYVCFVGQRILNFDA